MSEFVKDIKGQLAFITAKALDKKVDGRELGQNLDTVMDEQVGEKGSEKIQRGPVTNFFLEVMEGLWQEDPRQYVIRMEAYIQDIKDKQTEGA